MLLLLFGIVCINLASVAYIRYGTKTLKFFTALWPWIFTLIEMYTFSISHCLAIPLKQLVFIVLAGQILAVERITL